MSYEWLFRTKHQPFIIIFIACRTEVMASETRQQADAGIGTGNYSCFPTGLHLLYRRKCKFNYLFVHVSSLQARLHNLNGNRKPIYFFAADSNSGVILVPFEDAPLQHIFITSWDA